MMTEGKVMQRDMRVSSHKHDDNRLLACNVGAFKAWLLDRGLEVQEPNGAHVGHGVLFWVIPATGKAKAVSVQEGKVRNSRYAQTHFRLRSLIAQFMDSPLTAAGRAAGVTRKPAANQDAQQSAPTAALSPAVKNVPAPSPTAQKSPAKRLDAYLIDLRDDFALNCPLTKEHDETLAAFAVRRWEYAQAMVDARPQ